MTSHEGRKWSVFRAPLQRTASVSNDPGEWWNQLLFDAGLALEHVWMSSSFSSDRLTPQNQQDLVETFQQELRTPVAFEIEDLTRR